jgi:hypothetical protein
MDGLCPLCLKEQLAAAQKDAERYRWLRDRLTANPTDELGCAIVSDDASTWDFSIDAAIIGESK